MIRRTATASAITVGLAFFGIMTLGLVLTSASVSAENVVYEFAGLRGDVGACVWFDENLNERSEGALIRQTDMLYNRLALPPGAPVTVRQTATTTLGTQLAGIDLNRASVCTGVDAIRPSPQPSTP